MPRHVDINIDSCKEVVYSCKDGKVVMRYNIILPIKILNVLIYLLYDEMQSEYLLIYKCMFVEFISLVTLLIHICTFAELMAQTVKTFMNCVSIAQEHL